MKKPLWLVLIITLCTLSAQAQYQKITLDFGQTYLGEGQQLPAETYLLFSGAIPKNIQQVELNIYPSKGRDNKKPLYKGDWKRPLDNQEKTYAVPANYKLRADNYYDIELLFFEQLSSSERTDLLNGLEEKSLLLLESYWEEDKWDKNPKKVSESLEDFLAKELEAYRQNTPVRKQEVSPALALYLDRLEEKDRDSTSTWPDQGLLDMLRAELMGFVPATITKAVDSRYLDDCPTEDTKKGFSVSVGYAGVYLDGQLDDDFDYATSPYAGVSFPLGNSAFAPKFLSNTYLGFGVFFNDLEEQDGGELTGPVIGRPIYASLDYKLFQFVYLSAGATLLEDSSADGSNVFIRPFIGVNAKVNIALALEK